MKRNVDALAAETFDLLILGGGITGAGVALDAAVRGFRVALIDKGDFASGTSSVSSKLIHGGLRYLEHGQFPLVYEALRERRRLLHNAPHLVRPLRFLLPFYEAARVRPYKWRLGLTVYDLLAGRGNIRRSRPLTRRDVLGDVPALQPAGLLGGADYYDAQMDDARLCLEVIKTAVGYGACAANYVEAIAFERRGGVIAGIRAVDHVGQRELIVQARQVLNATGPWADAVRRLAGDAGAPHLQPTKGIHVVVRDLGLTSALLLLHPVDGRVFFVLPWMGKTLIGTTDTFSADGPDGLQVLPEEIAYLLDGYNHHFTLPLTVKDVLGTFAGLRPLLRARKRHPSSRSREFRIFASPSGLLTVAGGKYTTYRHMAELITDEIARRLGRRRGCRTHDLLLDGAPREDSVFFPAQVAPLSHRLRLSPESAAHLLNRYGRRAADVAAYVENVPEGRLPIVPGEPDLRAELAYQRDHEMAVFAADFLLRRTRLGLFRPELTPVELARAVNVPIVTTFSITG